MSQNELSDSAPQNDAPEQAVPREVPKTCSPRRRRRWTCGLLAGLLLGTFAAVAILLVCQPQYAATANIQIRPERPQFLFFANSPPPRGGDYEKFVNTHIVLMRSPNVIDRALENPDVTRLPIVIRQRDKREWLTQNLRINRVQRSETVRISIKTNSAEASEKIVNAVVDAYFNFIGEVAGEAPGQITPLSRAVPSMPNRARPVVFAGIGFVLFFFLPLIVCGVYRLPEPRGARATNLFSHSFSTRRCYNSNGSGSRR